VNTISAAARHRLRHLRARGVDRLLGAPAGSEQLAALP
jgi:hypothetical protein